MAEATESAAPRVVGAVAIALPAGLLVQALVDHAGYRHPVVPVVVWLGMLAVAAWLMPRARAGNLSNAHAAVAIAVAVAAVTAIGLDRRGVGAAMNVDWTILGVIWLLALLALISPAWVWVPGAALVTGIHSVFVVHALRLAYIFATDDALDRPTLSAQETRTLRLYATGLPIKSVARRLGIGEETAKQYVRRVREKYAQANRAAPTKVDLYHRAVEDGHLPAPP